MKIHLVPATTKTIIEEVTPAAITLTLSKAEALTMMHLIGATNEALVPGSGEWYAQIRAVLSVAGCTDKELYEMRFENLRGSGLRI